MRGSLSMFHSTIRGGVDMERRQYLERIETEITSRVQ
jgi:hypothetical protein